LKIEGKSNQAIADYLNSIGVESPLEYRISNGNTAMGISNRKGEKAQWMSTSVRRILENPIYMGTLVQGKTTSVSYRNRKRIQRDPSELTAFDNAHDAIISDTVFLIVQDLLKKDSYSNHEKKSYLFSGFAFCGNCGKVLYHRHDKGRAANWQCRNTSCKCKGSINEKPLTDAVFTTLKTHISLVLNPEEYLLENDTAELEQTISETELKEYEAEISRAKNAKEMLLIQKEKSVISQDDCDEMMHFYNDKIRKAEYQIGQIQHRKTQIQNCISEVREQYRQYAEMTELTRRLLVTFIEKIEVFSKTKIRIYFRYADFFKEEGGGKDGS
ncbi:MAG: recombinase family protein, partial [Oscillospiraceae bacterium]|nr:recombinase family protein [Oscillospiraceae bacterium]